MQTPEAANPPTQNPPGRSIAHKADPSEDWSLEPLFATCWSPPGCGLCHSCKTWYNFPGPIPEKPWMRARSDKTSHCFTSTKISSNGQRRKPSSNPSQKSPEKPEMLNLSVTSSEGKSGWCLSPSWRAQSSKEEIEPPAADATKGRLSMQAVSQSFSALSQSHGKHIYI